MLRVSTCTVLAHVMLQLLHQQEGCPSLCTHRSIWAFSSDKSTAVVLASSGVLEKVQPQGQSMTVASATDLPGSSLQWLIAKEVNVPNQWRPTR